MAAKKTSSNVGDHWMSISDLMSGLMMVFMLIAIAYMMQVQSEQKKQEQIIQDYAIIKHDIYLALYNEFKADLPRWNAEIDEKTLAITFKEPDVLFGVGSSELTPQFKTTLDDFLPRYLKILYQEKFRNNIEEIRIEGHTDPSWRGAVTRKEEYLRNMALSQLRTQSVLFYTMDVAAPEDKLEWMISKLTANGLSSSQPIYAETGEVDANRSRRVEFRVRTNADEKLNNLQEGIK